MILSCVTDKLVCIYYCLSKRKGLLRVTDVRLTGADKSLARPGRKQANVSVRMAFGI